MLQLSAVFKLKYQKEMTAVRRKLFAVLTYLKTANQ